MLQEENGTYSYHATSRFHEQKSPTFCEVFLLTRLFLPSCFDEPDTVRDHIDRDTADIARNSLIWSRIDEVSIALTSTFECKNMGISSTKKSFFYDISMDIERMTKSLIDHESSGRSPKSNREDIVKYLMTLDPDDIFERECVLECGE